MLESDYMAWNDALVTDLRFLIGNHNLLQGYRNDVRGDPLRASLLQFIKVSLVQNILTIVIPAMLVAEGTL